MSSLLLNKNAVALLKLMTYFFLFSQILLMTPIVLIMVYLLIAVALSK